MQIDESEQRVKAMAEGIVRVLNGSDYKEASWAVSLALNIAFTAKRGLVAGVMFYDAAGLPDSQVIAIKRP